MSCFVVDNFSGSPLWLLSMFCD